MPHVRRVGLDAEDAAAEYLAAQGFTLLTRRFKASGGEIDLVALEGDTLVFVEVKLRRRSDPLDAIDARKRQSMFEAAEIYLSRYDGPSCEVRFDVVTMTPDGPTLFRDAFQPR